MASVRLWKKLPTMTTKAATFPAIMPKTASANTPPNGGKKKTLAWIPCSTSGSAKRHPAVTGKLKNEHNSPQRWLSWRTKMSQRADEHPPPTSQPKVARSITEKNSGQSYAGQSYHAAFDRFDDATTSWTNLKRKEQKEKRKKAPNMSRTKTTQNAQGNMKNNTTKCALFLFPVQHQAPASRFRTLLSASDQTLNTAATKMRCSHFFARIGCYEKPCLHNAARRVKGMCNLHWASQRFIQGDTVVWQSFWKSPSNTLLDGIC